MKTKFYRYINAANEFESRGCGRNNDVSDKICNFVDPNCHQTDNIMQKLLKIRYNISTTWKTKVKTNWNLLKKRKKKAILLREFFWIVWKTTNNKYHEHWDVNFMDLRKKSSLKWLCSEETNWIKRKSWHRPKKNCCF